MEVNITEVDISQIDPGAACYVCARLLALYRIPFNVFASVKLGKVSKVLACECSHVEWIRNIKYSYGPVPRYGDGNLTAYKDSNQTTIYLGVYYSTQTTSTWNTSQYFELAAREHDSGHPGRGIILDPEWVNVDTGRTWYLRCLGEHGIKCDQTMWARGIEDLEGPDWLIDTTQARIIPSDKEIKNYISLSYTWGQTPNLRTTTHILDRLRQRGAFSAGNEFWNMIPETTRNAIEVTKLLGERYLWVDSLCIVQDDEEALHRSLEKMHIIFANSVLCIVAMAGQDANFGLRGLEGISVSRDYRQTVINLAKGEMLIKCWTGWARPSNELLSSIPGRSYSERAWTFQEFVVTKRRLIFDDDSIR